MLLHTPVNRLMQSLSGFRRMDQKTGSCSAFRVELDAYAFECRTCVGLLSWCGIRSLQKPSQIVIITYLLLSRLPNGVSVHDLRHLQARGLGTRAVLARIPPPICNGNSGVRFWGGSTRLFLAPLTAARGELKSRLLFGFGISHPLWEAE